MNQSEREQLCKDLYILHSYMAALERLAALAPPDAPRPKHWVVAADARQALDTRVHKLCAYVGQLERSVIDAE